MTDQDLSYPPVAHVHLLPNPKRHNSMNQPAERLPLTEADVASAVKAAFLAWAQHAPVTPGLAEPLASAVTAALFDAVPKAVRNAAELAEGRIPPGMKVESPITIRVEDETSSCSCGWHEHPSSEGWRVRTLGLKDPSCPLHGKGYVPGDCSCGHPAFSHDNLGCNRRTGHCDVCPCAVDVNTLTAKITGVGEADADPS